MATQLATQQPGMLKLPVELKKWIFGYCFKEPATLINPYGLTLNCYDESPNSLALANVNRQLRDDVMAFYHEESKLIVNVRYEDERKDMLRRWIESPFSHPSMAGIKDMWYQYPVSLIRGEEAGGKLHIESYRGKLSVTHDRTDSCRCHCEVYEKLERINELEEWKLLLGSRMMTMLHWLEQHFYPDMQLSEMHPDLVECSDCGLYVLYKE